MSRALRTVALATGRALPIPVRHAIARLPGFVKLHYRLLEHEGRTLVRVLDGPLRGSLLEVEPQGEWEYQAGTYEADTQRLLETLPLEGEVAWDVGAHVGFFSLMLAKRCRRVVAVEPAPDNARRLRENVRLNAASVDVVEAAVGRKPGVTRIKGEGRVSRISDDSTAHPVDRVTLDQLLERYGIPALVKIDIEGAEIEALAGAPELLSHRPRLLIEAHSPELLDELTQHLTSMGYSVRLEDAGPLFRPTRVLAEIDPTLAIDLEPEPGWGS